MASFPKTDAEAALKPASIEYVTPVVDGIIFKL
jgi:hypothetical protein